MKTPPDAPFVIRSFRAEDAGACKSLYRAGPLGGKLADNDTGLDIDDIASAYLGLPGCHFWVAQTSAGEIVGMIGVQHYDADEAQIRRLRVAHAHRRQGIGSALVEAALEFCQEHQYLKITLDTFIESEPAVRLFKKFQFRHERTRDIAGKQLMYFYLDLYSRRQTPNGAD
jgi:ribosomal protein S18 acetylase RimI-like enzyme